MYGGIEIEIPATYEHFVDNKKPEFLSKFPHGKIPAWCGADGFCLFEGHAIARYGEPNFIDHPICLVLWTRA